MVLNLLHILEIWNVFPACLREIWWVVKGCESNGTSLSPWLSSLRNESLRDQVLVPRHNLCPKHFRFCQLGQCLVECKHTFYFSLRLRYLREDPRRVLWPHPWFTRCQSLCTLIRVTAPWILFSEWGSGKWQLESPMWSSLLVPWSKCLQAEEKGLKDTPNWKSSGTQTNATCAWTTG